MAIFKPNVLFETVSGALARPAKKDGHKHGSYLVATHRVAATANPNCQRVYVSGADRYTRTTPLSGDETAARARFVAVAAAVKVRSKDLSKISADQQAFFAQKDTAGGCKTLRQWYWKVEGETYDQTHN